MPRYASLWPRFVAVAFTLAIAVSAHADIPKQISYQGRITNADGDPIPDGEHDMEFVIWDADTGGNAVWSSGVRAVTVSGGIFSIVLGEEPQPTIEMPFDADHWLEVSVESDVQSPRKRLTSVSYAYMASGLVPGTEVIGEVTTDTEAAIKGTNLATIGIGRGVFGQSHSVQGRGVWGLATSTTGINVGTMGETPSNQGWGVWGWATATQGDAWGVFGQSDSEAGVGVYGYAKATSGANYGVHAHTRSSEGKAVYGRATATTGYAVGVHGQTASTDGDGVFGEAIATEGTTYGGRFLTSSTAGAAVRGYASATTGAMFGGSFESRSTDGIGVGGYATAISGGVIGVLGETSSTEGTGVHGYAPATEGLCYGVYGETASTDGAGVYGVADDGIASLAWCVGPAMVAVSQSGGPPSVSGSMGLFAYAVNGFGADCGSWTTAGLIGETFGTGGFCPGIWGLSWSAVDTTLGVFGQSLSTDGRGVYGYATATSGITSGVYGVSESPAGNGVYGEATATTGPAFGVWGKTMSTSPGAYGVYYTGGLGGTGPMTGTVKTSRGPTILYCQESSECWFEEFGEAALVTGRAYIELDPLFLETVTIDENNPMKVFVQLHDETCQGVAVKKGLIGFDVIELRGGRSNSTFDFRVVAKRRGFESKRLEISEAARTDPYLYPEQREKDLTAIDRRRLLLKRKLEETAKRKTITTDGSLVSVHDYVDAGYD